MNIFKKFTAFDLLPALFFISGFAAIIYQIVWQRIIFSTFGINSESVTLVVSVFMGGLGLGALFGGAVQKRMPHRLLECFVAIECMIGLYGILSLGLIQQAGSVVPPDSLFKLFCTVAALLIVPTMLMGATLPILVTYLEKTVHSIGKTVGKLYALNTLGSAVAGIVTVKIIFALMGLKATLALACTCNIITAIGAYTLCSSLKKLPHLTPNQQPEDASPSTQPPLQFKYALFISAGMGAVALGLQTVWYRLIDFQASGRAEIFGFVLFVTLCGIAGGALAVKRHADAKGDMAEFTRQHLLTLTIILAASLPLLMALAYIKMNPILNIFSLMFLGLQAHKAGAIFPALCHLSIRSDTTQQSGSDVSYLYCANIIGSTLGCLAIGLILYDYLTIVQIMLVIFILSCGCTLLYCTHSKHQPVRYSYATLATLIIGGLTLSNISAYQFYNAIHLKTENGSLVHIVENRSGIITVEKSSKGDIIYGGGAYDGRFNIDPVSNSNIITRAYLIAALHANPKNLLEIGLSSGSWAKVFTMYTPLESLTSVEINKGYSSLLPQYDITKNLLQSPKARFVHDDGRRWLKMSPDKRFDVIISNTSFHFRNNAINLLSKEFLQLAKQHLNPNGVLFFNTTGAADCFYTAAHVFKHVVMVDNFVAASDAPFNLSPEQKRKNLLQFKTDNGTPVFLTSDAARNTLEVLVNKPFKEWHNIALTQKDLWLITDDNMATEYKLNKIPPQPYLHFWGSW